MVPVDNVPVEASAESRGRLAEVVEELVELAKQRFEVRGSRVSR